MMSTRLGSEVVLSHTEIRFETLAGKVDASK